MRLGLLVSACLLTAACAGTGSQVDPALFLPPATTSTTTGAASTSTTAPPSCTPGSAGTVVESSRPPGSMPAPGQMPAGTFMQKIQGRGRLIAGTSPDQLLFGFVNPLDNRVEGLDADLLREIAIAIFGGDPADPSSADAHVQFVTVTLAQRIPDVRSGAVDVVADTMTINCARRVQVDFSTEYYDAGQRVLVPANSTATSVEQLAGRKVCAAAKSTSVDNLHAVKVAPPIDVVQPPDQSDCLVLLQQGEVDAMSTDDTVLAGFAAQDPYTKVIGPRFTDEPYGLAISLTHPDLTAFVNGVLAGLRASGELQALYAKWVGAAFKGQLPPIPPARYRA